MEHQSQLALCSRGRKSPEKSLGRRDNRSVATFVKIQHLGMRGLREYGLCVIEPALLFTSEGAALRPAAAFPLHCTFNSPEQRLESKNIPF